jgi:two-component system cell cycle response regulator
MRVLIAEDDLVARRLLQKTLESWGYTVFTAENGRQAWEILQSEDLKLIIADWIMPVMDGITLCQKIRSSGIHGYVYFILLTGRHKKEDIVRGLEAGADDYVAKPFERDELKVRVRAGERIIRLEKELREKNETLRRLNVRLEELAGIDPLMGIGNRRTFHKIIEKVHHRADRYSQGYSIIMCDIDNFKSYNDVYGHLAGDQILKTVAAEIRKSVRASDEVFRFGGEEIVVVAVPEQDLEGTVAAAERMRRNVESLGLEHKGSGSGIVTISCGAALFDGRCGDNRWEMVLARADRALYEAKEAGKNRVCGRRDCS